MEEKREHSTHVRLCDASDAMLSFLAESKGEDKSKIAADILRRALLGGDSCLQSVKSYANIRKWKND